MNLNAALHHGAPAQIVVVFISRILIECAEKRDFSMIRQRPVGKKSTFVYHLNAHVQKLGSNDDVLLPNIIIIPREENLEDGEHRHEECCPFTPAQILEGLGQMDRELNGLVRIVFFFLAVHDLKVVGWGRGGSTHCFVGLHFSR